MCECIKPVSDGHVKEFYKAATSKWRPVATRHRSMAIWDTSLCVRIYICPWNIALTVQVPCTSRSLLKLDGAREMLSFCSLILECKSVSGGGCILLTRIKDHITLMYCSSGSAQGPLCDRHVIAIISVDIGLLIVWFPLRFFHPAAALIHLPMAAIKPPSSLTWPALVLPLRTVWQCSTALLQIRLQSVIVIMAMWLPSPAVSTHAGTHTHTHTHTHTCTAR